VPSRIPASPGAASPRSCLRDRAPQSGRLRRRPRSGKPAVCVTRSWRLPFAHSDPGQRRRRACGPRRSAYAHPSHRAADELTSTWRKGRGAPGAWRRRRLPPDDRQAGGRPTPVVAASGRKAGVPRCSVSRSLLLGSERVVGCRLLCRNVLGKRAPRVCRIAMMLRSIEPVVGPGLGGAGGGYWSASNGSTTTERLGRSSTVRRKMSGRL
jgi:hypothetical protein